MPNVLVRQASLPDAAHVARIHVESLRTSSPKSPARDVHARLVYGERQGRWTQILGGDDPSQFVLLVEDWKGKIIGFAAAGSDQEERIGDLYAVHVLASQQRKGVGRELVYRVAERLAQAGSSGMRARLPADSPARNFVESLGAREESRADIVLGDVRLTEVVYRWENIRSLTRFGSRRPS